MLKEHKLELSIHLTKDIVEQHVYANVAVTEKSTSLKNIQNYYMCHLQMDPLLNAL